MPPCTACGTVLPASEFSKAQLKKADGTSRCKRCVEQNKAPGQRITIDGSDPKGLGDLLKGNDGMVSANVKKLLDDSDTTVSDVQLCNILGALSCAERDDLLCVAQSEKESLLRGAVQTVRHDAASGKWIRTGKLSARGQGLADVIPGWCKDTFVVECNLGRHGEEQMVARSSRSWN